MNKHFYGKTAVIDILKNGKIYFPYLLTIMGSMLFYFLLNSIGSNALIYNVQTGEEAFKGASLLCGIIQSGSFAASVFLFVFLLYANSFVLKHQKKQFGLYRVLGMEHKHLIKMIITQTICLFGTGMAGAYLFGLIFDKLMLVLLFRIIGQTAPDGFYVNVNAIVQTLILALLVMVLILIINVFSMLVTKDIDLLKSEKLGEKEPKNRPLYALLGLVSLIIGYGIALKSQGVGSAINHFLPACLFVMYGTYVLFIAGSVSVLKMLKKNKKFYYQTKHFISVSGLLYRMKQNAAGLATICILSTAAIIVIGAGISLYVNGERGIQEQFPREFQLFYEGVPGESAEELVQSALTDTGICGENVIRCSFSSGMYSKTETGIEVFTMGNDIDFEKTPDTYILTLAEYNRFNRTNEVLADNELLLYAEDGSFDNGTMNFQGNDYVIKGEADDSCIGYIADCSMSLFSKLLIVVADETVYNKFVSDELSGQGTWIGFDYDNTMEETDALVSVINAKAAEASLPVEIMIKQQEQDAFYSMYGGILFVGGILGVMFLLCTVMIIYYKQISEGYEDRERFHIMQKVGMTKGEIKKVIHSQIMLVFFLPLVTAIIHSLVASKIVASCLQMVVTVHTPTFVICLCATCVLFSLIYMICYKITSKEYYNIVNA